MPCQFCGHTYFQHGGAGGRCNVPGCSCLAWAEPPDPAELARAQEAVRRAAVARAERQRDEAEAELARLRLSDPGTLEGTIATLLREGAAVLSVAESMEVNPRVVYEVARAIGALRGKGRPAGAARAEAIRLYKEGVPVDQIASRMGLPAWRVRRFLGMAATAEQK